MAKQMFYNMISDFIFIQDDLEKADIILVPGGAYPDCAREAARLYHAGYAPYILPSGRYAKAAGSFPDSRYLTEWEYLSAVLAEQGVPKEAVLKEDRATYTYENALFSREATDQAHLKIRRAILCCQAFHARRSLLYYSSAFPDTTFMVHSVVTQGIDRHSWFLDQKKTDIVLGEVTRIGQQFHCMLPLETDRREYDQTDSNGY